MKILFAHFKYSNDGVFPEIGNNLELRLDKTLIKIKKNNLNKKPLREKSPQSWH